MLRERHQKATEFHCMATLSSARKGVLIFGALKERMVKDYKSLTFHLSDQCLSDTS